MLPQLIYTSFPLFFLLLPELFIRVRNLIQRHKYTQKLLTLTRNQTVNLADNANNTSVLQIYLRNIDETIQTTYLGKKWLKLATRYQVPADLTPASIILVTIGLIIVSFNTARLVNLSFWGLTGALLLIEVIGLVWLVTRNKKLAAFEQELVAAMQALAKIYRTFPDLSHAIHQLSQNTMLTATNSFFQQVSAQIKVGVSPIEALDSVSQHYPVPSLKFIINSSRLSLSWGGDLATFYQRFAEAERQTTHAKRQMASIMFQNKVSAGIAAVMVPLVWLLAMAFSQNYRTVVVNDPTARAFISFALVWWMVGVVMVWRVMKAKLN